MTPRLLLLPTATLLVGSALAADRIRLTDGKAIENVQVVSEGLKDVVYKQGKDDLTVPADSVEAVEYDKTPPQLGEAEAFLLQDDPESAIDMLDAFVQTALDKPQTVRDFKWAPAQAAWRAVEVRLAATDFEGAKSAANRVITSFADTRFVPLAYLAKAAAEREAGQADQALKTLGDLSGMISAQSLSKRWELETRLATAQADPKVRPSAKRAEYEKVQGEAGAFPGVKAMAQVRIADSFLAEAAASPGGSKELRAKARAAYEGVLGNDAAPRSAVAAAHAGLGECLFLTGADADDKEQLKAGALECLRVATLYRDQGVTVARALFFAMRCFDLLPDPRRKAEMKRELLGVYPATTWATEAKKY